MVRILEPVPVSACAVAASQEGLLSAGQAAEHGISAGRASRLVAAGSWARLTHGVYDTAPRAERSPDAARRRQAWLALLAFGPRAIAVGPCALALLGVRGLPARIPAQAALPGATRLRSRDGVLLRQFDDGMTVVRVGSRFVASPEWALAQTVPEIADERVAVALMDDMLHGRLIDAEGLDRARRHSRGRRGVARTHAWWELADGRAESPLESYARVESIEAGMPPDAVQLPIRADDGRLVARGDLGWRLGGGGWLVTEIDGAEVHDRPEALFADRRRQNLLMGLGVRVLRFTARDILPPGRFPNLLRPHLSTDPPPSADPPPSTRWLVPF